MSGVVGIVSKKKVGKELLFSLNSIQHRGQDSAGIIVSDGKNLIRMRGSGLVSEVFSEKNLNNIESHIGIGHVRSSPEGLNQDYNIEPLFSFIKGEEFSIGNDGNIMNYKSLKKDLENEGISFHTHTDSELIIFLIARYFKGDIVESIRKTMAKLIGGYSCVIAMPDKLIAFRDRLGIRPLMVGHNEENIVVASENAAIEILGVDDYRDLEAGEIIVIDRDGYKSFKMEEDLNPRHCIFEYVYTSRPDANIDGINSYMFRRRCGETLFKESPVDVDLVCPVPDSGTPSAIGYAQASGIPFAEGLVRNRYMGRTFIKCTQEEREIAVKQKLAPQKAVIKGKRIVLVDDSIVRGTTSINLIEQIRTAGVKEIHLMITSPPFKYPCYYGVDTPNKDKLMANNLNIEEMREAIGVDSLHFISLEGLISASKTDGESFCKACFTGDYAKYGEKI